MKYSILLIFLYTLASGQEILLSEKFENLPDGWQIESTNKKRSWKHMTYNDTNYMGMSAYSGKGKEGYRVKTKLHSPLLKATDKICKLRFVIADAYQNGQPLQVILSDEKSRPIRSLPEKYWSELINNADRYDNLYENTAWIPLPQINKPYRISFIYNSEQNKDLVTTTIQLKEVDVWCE